MTAILAGMKLAEALALRADAARRAEQLREVDVLIQRTNWEVDLLD